MINISLWCSISDVVVVILIININLWCSISDVDVVFLMTFINLWCSISDADVHVHVVLGPTLAAATCKVPHTNVECFILSQLNL